VDGRELNSVHNSDYHSDPPADWGAAHVALRQRLGVLPGVLPPSGGLGVVLIIVITLVLMGRV